MCLDNAGRRESRCGWDFESKKCCSRGEPPVAFACSRPRRNATFRRSVVVDASGRATIIGTQLGLKRRCPLRKGTVWSYYRGARRREGIDAGETTVFTIRDRGWFWYIPLPEDIVSVGVVASPDYLFDDSDDFETVFLREVERCAPLKSFLAAADRVDRGARHSPTGVSQSRDGRRRLGDDRRRGRFP